MLIDTLGDGVIDLDRGAEFIMNSIQLNSRILDKIEED